MPAQPACFHRLDEILASLRAMTSTRLDRAAVEKLFRVPQRRARQIMADLEGLRAGNAPVVSRAALIVRLEQMVASPDSLRLRRLVWPKGSLSARQARPENPPRGVILGASLSMDYRTQSNEIQNHWLICIPPFPS